jgi:hypothetical protein
MAYIRLLTVGGVEEAHLSGNQVSGRFAQNLNEVRPSRDSRILEVFLNCPAEPEAILRFTRKYGPLKQEPNTGDEFTFEIQEFTGAQQLLREMWRNPAAYSGSPIDLLKLGGTLTFHGGTVTYNAPTLFNYFYADFVFSPLERFRICQRQGCPHPFFFAKHRNRQFCSEQCAEASQRESNREWWQKHGASWRAKKRHEAG